MSLFELKPGGRKLNVAHIHAKSGKGSAYFHEPQATISRDGSMILFASSWDDATRYAEDYMVGLPDSVYD